MYISNTYALEIVNNMKTKDNISDYLKLEDTELIILTKTCNRK